MKLVDLDDVLAAIDIMKAGLSRGAGDPEFDRAGHDHLSSYLDIVKEKMVAIPQASEGVAVKALPVAAGAETRGKAFHENLEAEIKTSLAMAEAPGRKLMIVAIWSDDDPRGGEMASGGSCRAVSEKTRRRDGMAFIIGLKQEINRIAQLIKVDPNTIYGEKR